MRPAGARRTAVVSVAALLVVVLTANLGFWQLRRAAQKVALQTAIDSRAALPVLAAADLLAAAGAASGAAAAPPQAQMPQLPPTGSVPQASQAPQIPQAASGLADYHYRRVHLQGRWAADETIFLDNRQMNARVGFYVVTPLRLADRPETAVLVQRGWVPRDIRDRTLLPPIATPAGLVDIDGTIAPPPARLFEFAPSAGGAIRQNLDLPAFAAQTGLNLLPLSVQQADDPAAAAGRENKRRDDRLRRDWPRPAVNVDMHYGYAFQWFALCGLMAGLWAWFQLWRPWRAGRVAL